MTTTDRRTTGQRPKRSARGRIGFNLFTTIPILIAGSMAVGFGLAAPLTPPAPKLTDKARTAPTTLAKSIRVALAAATRTAQASTPLSASDTGITAAPTTYVVVAGDTVSSIAGHYGIATASVLALNGLGWKSMIFPGQHLKLTTTGAVPVAQAPLAPVGVNRYTILSGDTMGSLAAKFGLPTATLLSANGLGWSSIIYPGQSIVVPGTGTEAPQAGPIAAAPVSSVAPIAAPSTCVVKSGDTITGIAARYGVTVQSLLTANGLVLSSLIFSGHTLIIPAGGPANAPAASAVSDLGLVSSTSAIPDGSALTSEMKTNARTIIGIGRSLGVPDYGIVIALAAALQESGLRNLHYGDRDSLGLFQQRPSAGWGTPAQVLDTTYASQLFFGGSANPNAGNTKGLLDISGWKAMSVTDAAQSVQRSGFPNAYAKWEPTARTALADLG